MPDNTTISTLHYLLTATVEDNGQCEPIVIRDGVQSGIDLMMAEGSMTGLNDTTTDIHGITVTHPRSLSELVMAYLGDKVEQTPDAIKFLEDYLGVFHYNFRSDRLKILTSEERYALVSGIANQRSDWERNGEDAIKDYARYGYHGWEASTDEAILEEAVINHLSVGNDVEEENILPLAQAFAKPAVWACLRDLGLFEAEHAESLVDLDTALTNLTHSFKYTEGAAPTWLPEAERLIESGQNLLQEMATACANENAEAVDSPAQ